MTPIPSPGKLLARALSCGLLVLLAGCAESGGEKAGEPTAVTDLEDTAPEDTTLDDTEPEVPRFFDVTAETGVDWSHETGAFGERWLPETLGPGVLIADLDGDERLDLVFPNGRAFEGRPGEAALPGVYLNRGGLRFREAAAETGLDFSAYCLGGAAADYDNDGDTDLYLACLGRDRLLRNDGGRFIDVSREAGLADVEEFGVSAVFFDADRDGWLDVYALRYVVWSPENDVFCDTYGQGKSYCTAALYEGAPARFYRGRGDGTFEEATREAGLFESDTKALGAVATDVDGDSWPDLAVACDTSANLLFHNRGGGIFENVAAEAGIGVGRSGFPRGGMGIDTADYDRDHDLDLAISYFSRDTVGLYENRGDLLFFDVGPNSEVGRKTRFTLGWGIVFFDYDLDGELDLLVANGHLDSQVERAQPPEPWAQPQQLFRNLGQGRFAEVTESAGGDLARPIVGRGAAFGDLDDDGDLDLVVTTNGGPARIFENRGPGGHWLRVDLEGTESNRGGVGARVEVKIGETRRSWRVRTGGSYLSQSQTAPTFGLGEASTVDEITIHWPSGRVQTLSDVGADRRIEVVEP